jgi:4-hydroxy-tetrahydrodipicolinate synthase
MLGNKMPKGVYTAMVTPLYPTTKIDWKGYEMNLRFQIESGITGPLSAGTTGESCTLNPAEHVNINFRTAGLVTVWRKEKEYLFHLAGVGSNNLAESIRLADLVVPRHSRVGSDGLLLVDPYYNGPSSFEIRTNYGEVFAARYPDQVIVPYVIPGRTGCALSAQDLALLALKFDNVEAVKEATGDMERMKKTRMLAPPGFKMLSGDDDKTFAMMTDQEIAACGVISVISNIAPAAVTKMCNEIIAGNIEQAQQIRQALAPLFGLVTVKAKRTQSFTLKDRAEPVIEEIEDKYRNPVPIKTIMNALGMPAGPCRPPLGKMLPAGIEIIRETLKKVWQDNESRWVLAPIEGFYNVKIAERLDNDKVWAELTYQGGD